jgi:thymidylate synthase ThyX
LKVRGYDVELYVEDSSVERYSQGTYSIMFDQWISVPKKEEFNVDKETLKKKTKSWMEQIDLVISQTEKQDIEGAKKLLANIDKKLKKYRTEGLRKGGEKSYENLVFKILRRNGYLGKLKDYETEFIDKKLSVEHKDIK